MQTKFVHTILIGERLRGKSKKRFDRCSNAKLNSNKNNCIKQTKIKYRKIFLMMFFFYVAKVCFMSKIIKRFKVHSAQSMEFYIWMVTMKSGVNVEYSNMKIQFLKLINISQKS